MNTPSPPIPQPSPQERSAVVWEQSVVPAWEARLAPDMIAAMELPEEGSVLVAECRTGYVPLELLKRLPERTRCVAIEPGRDMLDLARLKAGEDPDRRIWWDAKSIDQLKYRNGVFGASICAAGILTKDDVNLVAGELARLTQTGGPIGLVVPLRNMFAEFYDLYREALVAMDHLELEPMLDAYIDELFDAEALRIDLAAAGVRDAEIHTVRFMLPFESGQDFLLSPLVESLHLPLWLRLCPDDNIMQAILTYVLGAMDRYYDGLGLELTAEAAWVIGYSARG
ncbi:MAG: class I SAM-dependent methyltransferase [Myxococcota bacterium]